MLRASLLGRCPVCTEGPLFAGLLELRATCSGCGVRFDRYEGNWLGPTVLAYGIGAAAAAALGVILVRSYGFFRGLTPVLVLTVVVVAMTALRPLKAWWVWLLWTTGFVARDDEALHDEP